MSSPSTSSSAVATTTIAAAFAETAGRHAGEIALRGAGVEPNLTWAEWRDQALTVARALRAVGVGRGSTVALLLPNSPQFNVCDLGATLAGATTVSIYATSATNQIAYVLEDSDAAVFIVHPAFLGQALEARAGAPEGMKIVVVGSEAPDGCLDLGSFLTEAEGVDLELDAAVAAIDPRDILTLIYTSGTTGPPKGVQLTHANLLAAVEGMVTLLEALPPPGGRVISWLPSAHIAERAAHHYLPMVFGQEIVACPDPRQILERLPEVQPTWFFAPPRVWEKLKARVEADLEAMGDPERAEIRAALDAAIAKVRAEQAGKEAPADLAAEVARADEAHFAAIRNSLGFSNLIDVNSGAAPTPVHVLEFFHAIGVPVAEIWGMSEACGAWEGSGNVVALDVLRTMAKSPEAVPMLIEECERARGADPRLDRHLDSLKQTLVGLAGSDDPQFLARRVVGDMAVAFQASMLVQHAPHLVADAYCGAHLDAGGGGRYGTLPAGIDAAALIERALPA